MTIDLSRPLSEDFTTTNYTEQMSKKEVALKGALALTLGILPFIVTKIALNSLSLFSYFAHKLEGTYLSKVIVPLIGIPATVSALIVYLGAKVFAYSQLPSWGKYVK